MKTHILKAGLIVSAIFAGLAMSGCETTAGSSARTAVGCEKCKTVWVPGAGPSKATGYQMTKRMVCPDCVSAVENYFKTGELKHTCASCGSALKHCTTH